ncbi:MAG: hypothetical protein AAGB25_04975 [Pseudomonadota bacterium]
MTTPPSKNGPENGRDATPLAKLLFGWTESKAAQLAAFLVLGALSALLILLDASVDRHGKFEMESLFGFYGFYGFAAFSFVVLMGWPLGKLLTRPEDYYGEADEDGEDEASETGEGARDE